MAPGRWPIARAELHSRAVASRHHLGAADVAAPQLPEAAAAAGGARFSPFCLLTLRRWRGGKGLLPRRSLVGISRGISRDPRHYGTGPTVLLPSPPPPSLLLLLLLLLLPPPLLLLLPPPLLPPRPPPSLSCRYLPWYLPGPAPLRHRSHCSAVPLRCRLLALLAARLPLHPPLRRPRPLAAAFFGRMPSAT